MLHHPAVSHSIHCFDIILRAQLVAQPLDGNGESVFIHVIRAIRPYAIRQRSAAHGDAPVSDKQLQKLLLAREVSGMPSLIIAAYPVHGVDIGATESIHKVLISEKKRGAGVILISEDLEELYEMADRIGVLYEGKIVGVVSNAEFTYDKVGLMMTGSAAKEESEVH